MKIKQLLILVFTTLVISVSSPAQSVNNSFFRVEAYLQNPSQNGITIMWATSAPCYSWVEYGTDTSNLKIAHTVKNGLVVSNNTDNKIHIEELQPGTKYFYRICSKEIKVFQPYKKEFGATAKSEFASFKTLDNKGSDFSCLILNDLHNNVSLFDKLMSQVKSLDYDFTLFNGDCFTDLSNKEQAIKILQHYNKGTNAANKPAYYIRGNHEVRGAFALELNSLFDRNPYFAFTYGDTRFVVLDCGEDKPDSVWVYYGLNDFNQFRQEETQWLAFELRSREFKKAKKKILVHHVPIYYNFDDMYNPCKDLWNPLLQKAPFSIDINAHIHTFSFHEKRTEGNNPFPVVIGGGNDEKSAKIMLLQKTGNHLKLKVWDTEGNMKEYSL